MTPPFSFRVALLIYRGLLLLVPRRIRRAYGRDMLATFEALYQASAAEGWRAVARLFLREARDIWTARRRPRVWIEPFAAIAHGLDRLLHRDLDAILRDLKYGVRTLRRDAALTTFALLILGLGIGAASTVFNVFNALLLRPLPFEDPERLVWVANAESENLSAQTVQVMNLIELQEQGRSFAALAGFSPFYGVGDIRLTGMGEPRRVTGVPVTQRFFALLGVTPHLGRFFSDEESRWNAPRTVVLGHAFWRRAFAADPDMVGRAITLDGVPATVIGVLPASFDFASTFTPGSAADLFVPFPLSPETNRQGNTLAVLGRLRPGVAIGAAQAEASAIGQRIKGGTIAPRVWRNPLRPRLTPLRDRVSGRFRYALLVLAGAVAFVMLLVCANLSNLLLARASARQRDMAVRAALGADRHQLLRQMLVESLTLSSGGAAIGLLLAAGGTTLVSGLENTTIPLLHDVRLDSLALGFSMGVAVLTGIAFGVLPALRVSGVAPQGVLGHTGRGAIGAPRGLMQRWIVVAEITLVCVLLTGAGLLMRSLFRVLDVHLGFDSTNVLAVRVDPHRESTTRAERNAYFDELVRTVGAVPGVERTGLTDALPLGANFGWRRWNASLPGQADAGDDLTPLVRMVDDGYFAAMKIPLVAGRGFTPADGESSEPVVIVNEALARALWQDVDPVGQILETAGRTRRVVGVVGEVRYFALERDSGPEMYMPIRTGGYHVVDLVVRSALPPELLTPSIRAALKRVDPNLPTTEFRTMQQLIDRSVFTRRLVVLLIGGFAAFGLLLAALGIYAVLSYSVGQRRQEIGIRMALGASPGALERRILAETFGLAALGLIVGIPTAWLAARALRGLLYGIEAFDPMTFVVVIAVLAAVAALAGYIPARRASRIDPALALRT
jgi:predicted permease